jgi:hypothetical protein
VPSGARRLGVHVERLVRKEPPAKGSRTGVTGVTGYTRLIDGEPAGALQTQLGFHMLISWSGLDIGRDSSVSHYDAPFEFEGRSRASLSSCTTTRSSTATPSATRRWRGGERAKELLDLVVGRREIAQRHRDRDRFLGHVLEGDLELLA